MLLPRVCLTLGASYFRTHVSVLRQHGPCKLVHGLRVTWARRRRLGERWAGCSLGSESPEALAMAFSCADGGDREQGFLEVTVPPTLGAVRKLADGTGGTWGGRSTREYLRQVGPTGQQMGMPHPTGPATVPPQPGTCGCPGL